MQDLEFNFIAVRPGTKATSSKPILRVTSSPNHFTLNPNAVDLLGVQKGDKVIMLHTKTGNPDATYFIAKATDNDESAKHGEVGGSLHFSYSGIYGSIYAEELERSIVSFDELIDRGLYKIVVTPKGNKNKRGNIAIDYELKSVGEFDVNGDVREIFALTNRKERPVGNSDTDAEIESEVENEVEEIIED